MSTKKIIISGLAGVSALFLAVFLTVAAILIIKVLPQPEGGAVKQDAAPAVAVAITPVPTLGPAPKAEAAAPAAPDSAPLVEVAFAPPDLSSPSVFNWRLPDDTPREAAQPDAQAQAQPPAPFGNEPGQMDRQILDEKQQPPPSESTDIRIVPGTVELTKQMETTLSEALSAARSILPKSDYYSVASNYEQGQVQKFL